MRTSVKRCVFSSLSIFFLFFKRTFLCASLCQSAVTYDFSGGRLGDNLIGYLHAKWLSYQYQIPLVYKPFRYSSELMMDVCETVLNCSYQGNVELAVGNLDSITSDASLLYTCPYFPENPWDIEHYPHNFHFKVDWKNEEFRNLARKMISPKKSLRLIVPFKDTINMAIHIREGGGYDDENNIIGNPLKLPPMHFYIQGLSEVLPLFKGKPIYCYVFTDAQHPEVLVEELKKTVPSDTSIVFDWRRQGNHHGSNVLEDFFSLFHFDVLIRPQSNFSIVPSLLQDFAVVCTPTDFLNKDRQITITKIHVDVNQKLFDELEQRLNQK